MRLRAAGARVVAEEPGYGRGGEEFHASLVLTARIWAAQRRLVAQLAVEPDPVTVAQFVLASEAAMRAESVVGHRCAGESGPFTGWTIVAVADVLETASFGYYTIGELGRQRPAWLVGVNLPRGWAFRFVRDTLVDCVSPAGETHAIGLSLPL